MSSLNSLKKSELIALVEKLERNAEDDRRRIGVMMYEANQLQHRVDELESEVKILKSSYDDVEQQLIAAEERITKQGQVIAAQPKTAPPKKPAPKPLPAPSQVEMTPVVQITDADRRVWAAFNALPREKRNAYYEFAHSNGFGHLGLHNIAVVREAYLAKQAA